MGLPGKPIVINGAEGGQYYRDGRIREIADYCESDVVNNLSGLAKARAISRKAHGNGVSGE
jgi:hypothetical protein